MFHVANKDEGIKWPVTINEPRTGGAVKQHKVFVHFIVKGKEEIDELVQLGDFEFMRQVIDPEKGWEGFYQEATEAAKDEPVEYSEETLERYLQVPYIAAGFIESYFNFVAGVSAKNSRTRPRTG